jgi:hypothetical protein
MKPSVLIAFAASGAVIVLIKISEVSSPEIMRLPRRTPHQSGGHSRIGNRIPSL